VTDGRTDRQNYDFQGHASIAASRGKNDVKSEIVQLQIACAAFTNTLHQKIVCSTITFFCNLLVFFAKIFSAWNAGSHTYL